MKTKPHVKPKVFSPAEKAARVRRCARALAQRLPMRILELTRGFSRAEIIEAQALLERADT